MSELATFFSLRTDMRIIRSGKLLRLVLAPIRVPVCIVHPVCKVRIRLLAEDFAKIACGLKARLFRYKTVRDLASRGELGPNSRCWMRQ